MRSYLVMVIFASWLCHGYSQNYDLRKQIERIIKYDLNSEINRVPGFMVGIIDQDQTFVEKFGINPITNKELIGNEIFEISNISKAVTFEVCSLLENKLSRFLDAIINNWIDEKYKNPRLNQLTIRALLNIENIFPNVLVGNGLIDIDGLNPYHHLDNDALFKLFKNFIPEQDNLTNVYSNIDYGLIQPIVENFTGQDFQTVIDQTINEYLDSKFFYTRFEQFEHIVTPGIKRSGTLGKPWDITNFASALGMKASMSDLLNFARYKIEKHLEKDISEWSQLHDKLSETWNPQVKAFEGMFLIKINNYTKVLVSSGQSDIHNTFIAIAPLTKTAVIVLSNSSEGTQDLGMLVLRMINNKWKRKTKI